MKSSWVALWVSLCISLGIWSAVAVSPAKAETLRDWDGFSLDIGVATVARDGFDVVRPGFGINPRWCWRGGVLCWWVDIWWIIGPRPDP